MMASTKSASGPGSWTGGFKIRHYLSELDPLKIQAMTRDLVTRLQVSPVAFATMSEAATSVRDCPSLVANSLNGS